MSVKEEKQEIIGIKVLGEKFENLTEFRFWDRIYAEKKVKNVWICLVYGKNSVGKSSICKIVQNNTSNNETYKKILICENEEEFNYQNSRTQTEVFNVEYIQRHIKQEKQKLTVILPDELHDHVYTMINETSKELSYFVTESSNDNFDHILGEIDNFKSTILKNYLRNEAKYNKYPKKNDDVKNFEIIKKICDNYKQYIFNPFEAPVWKIKEDNFEGFINVKKKSERSVQEANKLFEEENISIIIPKFNKEISHFLYTVENIKFLYYGIIERLENLKILLNDQEIIKKIDLIWLEKMLRSKIITVLNNKSFDNFCYIDEVNDWALFNQLFLNYESSKILKEIYYIKLFLSEKIDLIGEIIKKNINNDNFSTLDIITDNIKYITRSDHNLKFTIDDGINFNLNIGEKTIQLKNLSTSEKNIVALVYFFASTFIKIVRYLKNKKESKNKT